MDFLHLMPREASSIAAHYDAMLYTWIGACAFVAFGVFFLMIGFAVRYHRKKSPDREQTSGVHQRGNHHALEWAWIVTPLVIFIAMFFWSAALYARLFEPPVGASKIAIVAKQWMWKAQHDTGQREIDTLHLPVGRPVQLVMTSQDAIHSFFVPAFRIKRDVVPGRYSSIWFTPTEAGTYHLFCAEFCGTDHARMGGDIVVMPVDRYAAWLDAHATAGMAERGAERFRAYGCSGCHGDNSTVHAPHLAGVYGKPVALADGRTVIADAAYVRDSILLPVKDVVAGYAPIMPSFAGRIGEDEILEITAYLESLSEPSR